MNQIKEQLPGKVKGLNAITAAAVGLGMVLPPSVGFASEQNQNVLPPSPAGQSQDVETLGIPTTFTDNSLVYDNPNLKQRPDASSFVKKDKNEVSIAVHPLGVASEQSVDATPLSVIPVGEDLFYNETNGGAPADMGYFVRGKMREVYGQMGRENVWGPPVSREYVDPNGRVSQAFQRGIFQLSLDGKGNVANIEWVNVFDLLSQQGKDAWLMAVRQTPKSLPWAEDAGKSWDQIVANHVSLLDQNPAIKETYFKDPLWLQKYGLPMAPPSQVGDLITIRCQRAVFQQWLKDVPWAKAGDVTIGLGGDIAKEAGGIIPQQALALEKLGQAPPTPDQLYPPVERFEIPWYSTPPVGIPKDVYMEGVAYCDQWLKKMLFDVIPQANVPELNEAVAAFSGSLYSEDPILRNYIAAGLTDKTASLKPNQKWNPFAILVTTTSKGVLRKYYYVSKDVIQQGGQRYAAPNSAYAILYFYGMNNLVKRVDGMIVASNFDPGMATQINETAQSFEVGVQDFHIKGAQVYASEPFQKAIANGIIKDDSSFKEYAIKYGFLPVSK